MCLLAYLHAGTVFFIGEKEGRISHESLTALSFYVVGGNLLFTLYLMAVYVRAALRESRTGGVSEQRRKSQLVAAQQARRLSLNAALGRKAVLQKAKSLQARELLKGATVASEAHREALVDKRSAAAKRLKRRLEVRPKMKADWRVPMQRKCQGERQGEPKANAKANAKASAKANAKVAVEPRVNVAGASAHVDVAGAKVAIAEWQTAWIPKRGVLTTTT